MANTNASGIIALTDLQSQFGGTNPISILDYLSGNGAVGFGAKNVNGVLIPSSPPISLANFYGIGAFVNVTNSHSTSGAFTETTPPGAVFVQIEVVGASGGGGGGGKVSTKGQILGGGGGGSGAISRSAKLLISGNAVTIKGNVGAAGANGADANAVGNTGFAGTAGGASNVQSGTFSITTQTAAGGAVAVQVLLPLRKRWWWFSRYSNRWYPLILPVILVLLVPVPVVLVVLP